MDRGIKIPKVSKKNGPTATFATMWDIGLEAAGMVPRSLYR